MSKYIATSAAVRLIAMILIPVPGLTVSIEVFIVRSQAANVKKVPHAEDRLIWPRRFDADQIADWDYYGRVGQPRIA